MVFFMPLSLSFAKAVDNWVNFITQFFSSVQFSHSVMSDSLRPHTLQHARLPCPSPTPGACSNSHPLSQWCHPTISSSVGPVSSCLQSFPASGSFPMSWFFTSGGQSIGVSYWAPCRFLIDAQCMLTEAIDGVEFLKQSRISEAQIQKSKKHPQAYLQIQEKEGSSRNYLYIS